MHIKRSPAQGLLSKTQLDTLVLVKTSTPYQSALKRIDRILDKFDKQTGPVLHRSKYQNGEYKKVKYIVIKGMGKCIQKTISIALHYQTKGYVVDIYTGTVEVVDTVGNGEVIETREGPQEQTTNQVRAVGYVEAKIWLKK